LFSGSVYRINQSGDFNGDGFVNAGDLTVWSANFGTAAGATPRTGDADADGDVDGADFLAWQRNVGASAFNFAGTPSDLPIPEPTGLLQAILGLAMLGKACQRQSAG
jgi:hypothetical protein